MLHNVLGLYRDEDIADKVVDELEDFGCEDEDITVVTEDDGEIDVKGGLEDIWDDDDEKIDRLPLRLETIGVPRASAQAYLEGIRNNGALVIVRAAPDRAEQIAEIMRRHGAIDINARGASAGAATAGMQRQAFQGNQGMQAGQQAFERQRLDTERADLTREGDVVIPVIEEEVRIGKREIEQGGVRIFTHVVETPVEEQVSLREERVSVDRHAVDRPVSDEDMRAALSDQTFELQGRSEEVVVDKRARVVEEVVLKKEVGERTETVRETAHRTEVRVEEIPGRMTRGFETFENDFRDDWKRSYATSGFTYDQLAPAYKYGYSLANDQRFKNARWETIEPNARTTWEERNPNSWDKFKGAIKTGWEKMTGQRPMKGA